MASLVKRGKWYSIRFTGSNGKEKLMATDLGNEKKAREVLNHVEALIEADKSGRRLDSLTAEWLTRIGSALTKRLAKVGLVVIRDESAEAVALGPFIASYIKTRTDVKDGTSIIYSHAERNLKKYFGADRPLASINAGDADEFGLWLRRKKPDGEGLSEATARRRIKTAKQFCRVAIRKGYIEKNPFEGLGGVVRSNKARMYFVSREEAAAVLASCPDAEWRLIFALSRFGGLRTPSEHYGLRWADVDWERGKFLVRSPKTEHHEGGESRWVPIFPELRPYLEAVFHDPDGSREFVITKYRDQANLRTRFRKIIKRAGLTPWPKLFHNLRSTRQTELSKQFPIHLVCAWLGNKAAIAQEHYLQVTDEDFVTAAGDASKIDTEIDTSPSGTQRNSDASGVYFPSNIHGNSQFANFQVSPVGLEPTTLALKVPCSTN
jgi:integrase